MMLMQVLAAASLEYSRGACIGVHTRVRNAPLPRALPASGRSSPLLLGLKLILTYYCPGSCIMVRADGVMGPGCGVLVP